MSAQFTPGPWEVVDEVVVWGDCNESGATGRDGKGYPVAEAVGPRHWLKRNDVLGWEQREANAHLIAAAPELYEALEQAREWLAGWASAEPYIAAIDEVLAKARGQ